MAIVQDNNSIKPKQSRQRWVSLTVFVVLMLAIIAVTQPWRKVQTVTVNSMEISAKNIEKYANVTEGTSYWRVLGQTSFIAHRIVAKSNKIDSARVKLQGNHIEITVVEKVTAGYVQQNKQWFVIDRNGKLTKVTSPKGNAPVYAGFKSNKTLNRVVKQFVNLELTMRQNISQITFSPVKDNPNRLVIIMDDGNTVYASQATFAKKISYYPSMAAQMTGKGVVDLQFGAYSYVYGKK